MSQLHTVLAIATWGPLREQDVSITGVMKSKGPRKQVPSSPVKKHIAFGGWFLETSAKTMACLQKILYQSKNLFTLV